MPWGLAAVWGRELRVRERPLQALRSLDDALLKTADDLSGRLAVTGQLGAPHGGCLGV